MIAGWQKSKREFGVFRGGADGVLGWCQSKDPPLVNLGPRHRHLNPYSNEATRERVPFILNPMRSDRPVNCVSGRGQL